MFVKSILKDVNGQIEDELRSWKQLSTVVNPEDSALLWQSKWLYFIKDSLGLKYRQFILEYIGHIVILRLATADYYLLWLMSFPGGAVVKNLPTKAGDTGSIPVSGRSSGEGNGNPLQYYLENPMDRRAWWATVHRVAKELDMTEYACIVTICNYYWNNNFLLCLHKTVKIIGLPWWLRQ